MTDEERLMRYGFSPDEIETFLNDHASHQRFHIIMRDHRGRSWIFDSQENCYMSLYLNYEGGQRLIQTMEAGRSLVRNLWYKKTSDYPLNPIAAIYDDPRDHFFR